jgi:CheY-like chemotaxis protein
VPVGSDAGKSVDILIADSDAASLAQIAGWLDSEGHRCQLCIDGRKATELLRTRPLDLLILDTAVPGNENLQLAQEARAVARTTPILITADGRSLEPALAAIELGVDGYLLKPLQEHDLRRRVRVLLERSQRLSRQRQIAHLLRDCARSLETESAPSRPPSDVVQAAASSIPAMTLRILAACLSELLILRAAAEPEARGAVLCDLLDCPQRPAHRGAILETIEVLQRTKGTFKSKELATLRVRLERLLGKSPDFVDEH